MRPLSELDATALRGVFSDIDDTLTHDGAVVLDAYAAILKAKAAGLRVVLVTGRPAGWAEVLASIWPVDAAIAENGGIAYLKRGRRVERIFFDDGGQDPRLAPLVADVLARFPFARLADDSGLRITDAAFDVNETQHLAPAQIAQLTDHIRALGARTLVSSVHAHACFHAADKATMAARVAKLLWNEDPAATSAHYAFVGDSPNDQAAFTFFHASVGVANVARYLDQLDPPPRFVTPSPSGRGFAELVDAMLRR